MKNKTLQIAKTVIVLGSLFGFVAVASAAWTLPPTGTVAPANNVAAPVNIGATGQSKAGSLGVIGLSNTGTTLFSHKLDVSDTAVATTGFFATYPDHFYSKFPALFDATVGIRGVLGFTQAGGGLITPTTGGTYNRPLVQGVEVCLANGANCPGGSGMTGSGTANYLSKFTGASSLGNSAVYESGGNVGIGTTGPTQKLSVIGGAIYTNNNLYADGQGIIGSGLRVGAGGAPANMLSVTGNADISGNLTVGGSNVCRQDGTNCPAAGITLYRVVPNPSPGAGFGYACARLLPTASFGDPAMVLASSAGGGVGYFQNGTITFYPYCGGSSGSYVWANNPIGHLAP